MGLKFVEKNQMGQRYAKHQMQSGRYSTNEKYP